MALIKCPECGKEISDKSKQCIHCGYPLSDDTGIESYTVILNNVGVNKPLVIRCVREINNIDILPAKQIVDRAPVILAYDISYENAIAIQSKFGQVGASVSIRKYRENDILAHAESSNEIRCPRCGSNQITTGQRGFSIWTGFLGSNKTMNRCAKCGHNWQPK